jgi:hypothetical protein
MEPGIVTRNMHRSVCIAPGQYDQSAGGLDETAGFHPRAGRANRPCGVGRRALSSTLSNSVAEEGVEAMGDAQVGTSTIASEEIKSLVIQSALPGADRLDIGAQLEALSSKWVIQGFLDLGVDAQVAAVSVLTGEPPLDYDHAFAAAGSTHTLVARLQAAGNLPEAASRAADAITAWNAAASFARTEQEIDAVAIQLTLLQKLLLSMSDTTLGVQAQKSAVGVLADFDAPPDQKAAHDALQADMVVTLQARLREQNLPEAEVQRQVTEIVDRRRVEAELNAFYQDRLAILVVGSPTSQPTLDADGAWRQQFRFGSIIKPQDAAPQFETRWAVTVEIAAIKCFGTDDAHEDEPYVVTNVYDVDPLVGEQAVSIKRIDFPSVREKAVFAQGSPPLASGFFIPGDGHVRLIVALFDREAVDQQHFEQKWAGLTKAAILGGLAKLHPLAAAGGAVLEVLEGVVSDIAIGLLDIVSGPFADDLIGQLEFKIDTNFLERLKNDPNALPRRSDSIPGIVYNFPETPEGGPAGGSWLFSNGDASYRIFFIVRTAPLTLTPEPQP